MRLITCKNKQTRKCGSPRYLSFNTIFRRSRLLCSLSDYETFIAAKKEGMIKRRSMVPKTTAQPSPTFDNFFAPLHVHKFYKSCTNFNRIERQRVPEKVQKGFESTKEDLHTLWCEYRGANGRGKRGILFDFLHKLLIEFDVWSFSANKFSMRYLNTLLDLTILSFIRHSHQQLHSKSHMTLSGMKRN